MIEKPDERTRVKKFKKKFEKKLNELVKDISKMISKNLLGNEFKVSVAANRIIQIEYGWRLLLYMDFTYFEYQPQGLQRLKGDTLWSKISVGIRDMTGQLYFLKSTTSKLVFEGDILEKKSFNKIKNDIFINIYKNFIKNKLNRVVLERIGLSYN